MDKPVIYKDDEGTWYLYAKGMTDIGQNGAFLLTSAGEPGSWYLTRCDHFVANFQAEYQADVIQDWRPPVITTDKAVIAQAEVMVDRILDGKRRNKAERELTDTLTHLRDQAFIKEFA